MHLRPYRLPVRPGTWEAMVRADPCAFCGRRPAGEVDHIVPRRRNLTSPGVVKGENAFSNSAAACRDCNDAKGTQSLLLFLLWVNDCVPAADMVGFLLGGVEQSGSSSAS